MVDIQTEIIPDDITEVLLLANQEIMLSSNAIFELKIVPLKDFLQESPIENDKYIKLELTHKGSLNNLRWTEHIKDCARQESGCNKTLICRSEFS